MAVVSPLAKPPVVETGMVSVMEQLTTAVMGVATVTAAATATVMAVGKINLDHKTYPNKYKFT
jgi:hypothetical protein